MDAILNRVDDICEACGRSVCERFPGDLPPAFCDACEDEFDRELRYIRDEPAFPADVLR